MENRFFELIRLYNELEAEGLIGMQHNNLNLKLAAFKGLLGDIKPCILEGGNIPYIHIYAILPNGIKITTLI